MTRYFLFFALVCVLHAGCVLPNVPQPNACFSDAAMLTPGTAVYSDIAMGPGLGTLRYAANFSLAIPTSPGFYKITVTAVEPNKTGSGQRLFTITANGAQTQTIDLWANAGTLGKSSITLYALSNGALKLDFKATVWNALYNRIDYVPAGILDVFTMVGANPQIVSIERKECVGAGSGFNCGGLQLWTLTLIDGRVLGPYVGIAATDDETGSPFWRPLAFDAPSPVVP